MSQSALPDIHALPQPGQSIKTYKTYLKTLAADLKTRFEAGSILARLSKCAHCA